MYECISLGKQVWVWDWVWTCWPCLPSGLVGCKFWKERIPVISMLSAMLQRIQTREPEGSNFESWLCHLQAVLLWASKELLRTSVPHSNGNSNTYFSRSASARVILGTHRVSQVPALRTCFQLDSLSSCLQGVKPDSERHGWLCELTSGNPVDHSCPRLPREQEALWEGIKEREVSGRQG